jgi:hypothetical protein
LAAGGALGGALGFVLGGAIGVAASAGGLGGVFIGAVIGESIGIPVGVHAAGRGRGRVDPALLLSVGLGAAGILALDQDVIEANAFYATVPLLQLTGSILIERHTGR